MDVTYSTKAIVLVNQPWRECDSRVVFYTEDNGKLDLIARGTKKTTSKLAGHLQPYNLVKVMVINGRRFSYAGAVDSLDCFLNIKNDWDKLQTANHVFKVWYRLISNQEPDSRLFNLLVNFLQVLDKIKAENLYYQFLAQSMLFKALCYLGYQPDIEVEKSSLGFLDQADYHWQKLSKQHLIILQGITKQTWPASIKNVELNKQTITEVNAIIERLIILVLER